MLHNKCFLPSIKSRSSILAIFFGFALLATAQTPFENIFDVSTDVLNGGCTPDQITQLNLAFTECIQMVNDIQNGIAAMSVGLDSPNEPEDAAIGWMFTYLFGLPGTEKRALDAQRNVAQVLTSAQMDDNLGDMNTLMETILEHATGTLQFSDLEGNIGKTKIYCNPSRWRLVEWGFYDPARNTRFQLLSQVYNEPGMYLDIATNNYSDPPVRLSLQDPNYPPELAFCGTDTLAMTNTISNIITVDTTSWNSASNTYNLGNPLPVTTATVAVTEGTTFIDQLRSLSMTLLHEYTHLVAKGQPSMPPIVGQDEQYGYTSAVALAADGGAADALASADSYALLGGALLMDAWDWRDGFARSPAFWSSNTPSIPSS